MRPAACEFVTPMRMDHVLDAMLAAGAGFAVDMSRTPAVMAALAADVLAEEPAEDSPAFRRAVSKLALPLWKARVAAYQREALMGAGS